MPLTEVPTLAASSFRNFKSKSGTSIMSLLVPPCPKFVPEGAAMYELRESGALDGAARTSSRFPPGSGKSDGGAVALVGAGWWSMVLTGSVLGGSALAVSSSCIPFLKDLILRHVTHQLGIFPRPNRAGRP